LTTCLPWRTEAQCNAVNGIYQGHGTGCTPNPCSSSDRPNNPLPSDSSGACCSSTTCLPWRTELQCQQVNGVYQGHGKLCTPNPCSDSADPKNPSDSSSSSSLSPSSTSPVPPPSVSSSSSSLSSRSGVEKVCSWTSSCASLSTISHWLIGQIIPVTNR
jgi:hypothetical protein